MVTQITQYYCLFLNLQGIRQRTQPFFCMVYGVLGTFYFLFYNGDTENTEFFFSVFSVPLVVFLFYN